MTKKTPLPFEASARLQRMIGRELIPNDEMAIVELVKNAYDSGAHNVRIFIQPERSREPGVIRISDDGTGMSEAEIEKLFMFAGYSARPDQLNSLKRVPTGEKGIGRFAADKLGRTLDVYTTKGGGTGIHLSIDWRKFDVRGRKKFSDITADYEIKDVKHVIREPTGTVLEIGRLSSKWDDKQVKSLVTWLRDLLNPISKPKDFSIELEIGGSKRGIIKIDPVVLPESDVSMELTVAKGKVRRIIRDHKDNKHGVDEVVGSSADLGALNRLHAKFVHFDQRPTKKQRHGLGSGVRVYRDGFRIEPFGSRESDWLGVLEKRAKRAGHAHIVPNRLFGFVEISRRRHPDLSDTTSRQALLDTDAARTLKTVLGEALSSLDGVLRSRKEPQWKESRARKQSQLEQARLHALDIVASGLAHELRQPLQTIRSEADNIREKLKQLGIDDPDIKESQESIDRNIDRINNNISFVSDISKGNPTDLVKCDLVEFLKEDIAVFSNRCTPLGINVTLRAPPSQMAMINKLALSIITLNFLQNAMDSIESSSGKSIVITLRKTAGYHRIEVEDDGGGVPKEVESKLFSTFATNKTGGMGIGLRLSKICAESHRGRIGYEPRNHGALFWVELPGG